MARRSSRRNTRDANSISKSHLRFSESQFGLTPYDLSRQESFDFDFLGRALRDYEDRRAFHPEGPFRPAASFNRPSHRLVVQGYAKVRNRPGRAVRFRSPSVGVGVSFERPEKVLTCVRRRQRREVLFARRKAGRSGQRRARWSWFSRVRCG